MNFGLLLCLAAVCVHTARARLSSSTSLDDLKLALFRQPSCHDFLGLNGNMQYGLYGTRQCGSNTCSDYPQSVCSERLSDSFKTDGPGSLSCRRIPTACYNAANSGSSGPSPAPAPRPSPQPAPRPSPQPAPRPSPQPAPRPSPVPASSGGQSKADCNESPSQGTRCPSGGPGYARKWFYNRSGNECRQMLYRGCGGTKNNFADEATCKRICLGGSSSGGSGSSGATTSKCDLPRSSGVECNPPSQRRSINYFYDKANSACRYLVYRGCGGNANRFSSRNACEAECG